MKAEGCATRCATRENETTVQGMVITEAVKGAVKADETELAKKPGA